ncbi:MAG: aminopeptidase N, partial [Actinomycetota bacterium]|nr:aminopeptidase N [Actinomycetota bacterium]
MTSPNNLTRAEARERARLLRVETYHVELDLRDQSTGTTFASTSTLRFTCTEPGVSSFLDLTAPALRRAVLNGRELDVSTFDGNRLPLPDLAGDNELRVEADCAYMRTGEGLHRFVDPVDSAVYLYTQFETFDAHRMYGCFDQPDLKAAFRFVVHALDDWTCVSNAVATREGCTWTFAETPRMSTYITALVAGPYAEVHDSHHGIPLGLYCRRSLAEHLDA